MGAEQFAVYAGGSDLQLAFAAAREAAAFEHGHAGYSGTIAEKGSLVVVERTPMTQSAAYDAAWALIDADDPRVEDKWGPAGAIAVGDAGTVSGWLLFGSASS